MAKSSTTYVCQSCGASAAKWSGKCEACGGWNTITEEGIAPPLGGGAGRRVKGRKISLEDLKTEDAPPRRRPTGIAEFDRVTGGGLVPGSALLVGGDPGIGKSTIILQALGKYAQNGGHAVYISGEEAMAQVRMRAARMGLSEAPLMLGAATCVEDILATLESGKPPAIVAIDSIQTLWTGALDAAPGTIAQVRTASFDLVRYAKASGAALLLVGHVTKDGQIAGPKAVEHLVDAVLYFEGERGHHFRVLRAVKNRFGATDEIGVFEMTGKGLAEVANPSALFLGDRKSVAPGTAVFAGLEGTRPLLCEIQALVSATAYGTPRRAVSRRRNQRLDLHEKRARALEAREHRRARRRARAIAEKQRRRIGDFGQALAGHLEDADLVGGAETVLDRAQHAEVMTPLTFEIEHRVDQMFDRLGPGNLAVLGDMADQQQRRAAGLGVAHQ
ncbi:MAG TPA: ATPase domain-containing protein, partial [Rhizomicrobium sp.]|nr:ATPase domain-containing protein [Rhizomicrobium sp.]